MNMKSIHQNLLRWAETLGSRNYATLRRVMFTVAMAAGVCGAAWSQGTTTVNQGTTTVSQGTTTVSQGTTTVVQAGQNVTKIAEGAVSGGATVQVASGTTVSIEGAAPAAGKVARLKLTRKAEKTENGQSGESGISLSQNASLESTDDNDETLRLKHNIESNDFNYLPDDIRDQLPDNASITDILTLTLENYSTGDLTATIKFDTPFAASADVWIVFAYPIDDGDASWFIVQGTAVDDGSVQTTIPTNTLAQLANKKFIAFAFDKKQFS